MSVTVGKYHLYQRETPAGKYFYYWYEENGRRITKACGRCCDSKRQAVQYLENLLKNELEGKKQATAIKEQTFETFAKDMFIAGAPHLARWAAKGKVLKEQTIDQHRRHLTKYLLPQFGNLRIREIMPTAVEDFLLGQRLSNSCRNTIMYTLKTIMREARRAGLLDIVPELEPFRRNGRRQDTLSSAELNALFPSSIDDFIRVWRRPDTMRKEPDEIALMFGTLFCVTVSAGLRSGEIRALHRDQIAQEHSGLLIDRAMDERGNIGLLKKATADDTRSRAVVIPALTMNMLNYWQAIAPELDKYPGLVFSYRQKPVANYYILDRFRFGLDNVGIDYKNRRLTVHCLRYTYNTRMRTLLSEQVLREFVGHRSIAMTDHYDRPILIERLAAFKSVRPAVEQFWG